MWVRVGLFANGALVGACLDASMENVLDSGSLEWWCVVRD